MIATHPNLGLLQWAHRLGLTRLPFGQTGEEGSRAGGDVDSGSSATPDVLVICESARGRAGAVSEAKERLSKSENVRDNSSLSFKVIAGFCCDRLVRSEGSSTRS